MPKALSDLDKRTKWMLMKMTSAFILHLNEVGKWDEFKESYNKLWKDQGGIRGPETQRQIAARTWDAMQPFVPLPAGVKPFEGTQPPPPMDMGSAPAVHELPPGVESNVYEIEEDVDDWACFQWARAHIQTVPNKIMRWRSQLAREYHAMCRDRQTLLKLLDIFKARIAGQVTVDRQGKIDDGTTELDLAQEVLAGLTEE